MWEGQPCSRHGPGRAAAVRRDGESRRAGGWNRCPPEFPEGAGKGAGLRGAVPCATGRESRHGLVPAGLLQKPPPALQLLLEGAGMCWELVEMVRVGSLQGFGSGHGL